MRSTWRFFVRTNVECIRVEHHLHNDAEIRAESRVKFFEAPTNTSSGVIDKNIFSHRTVVDPSELTVSRWAEHDRVRDLMH